MILQHLITRNQNIYSRMIKSIDDQISPRKLYVKNVMYGWYYFLYGW